MTDNSAYKQKYEHNEQFVSFIQEQGDKQYPDWEIIVTFYAALHYMNLYLNKVFNTNIEDISNHQKRNAYIKENCNPKIALAYKTLYDLSQEARYQYTDVSLKTVFVKNKYKELKNLCQQSMLKVFRATR